MFHPARWTLVSCVTLIVMATFIFSWHEGAVFAEADMGNKLPTPRERYLAADTERELETARREYVRDLLKRYGDSGTREEHIDPFRGGKYLERANRLFREWNPVFSKTDHVRELLGPPRDEDDTSLRYFFIDGAAGGGWRFKVSDGTIMALEYIPGA